MDPKIYSIASPTSKTDGVSKSKKQSIVSLKLTDELVEKLMKGQKDLNNLVGVEFIMSNNGSMDVKTRILVTMINIQLNILCCPLFSFLFWFRN